MPQTPARLTRRAALAGAAASLAAPAIAQAPWPNRPIKLIVPYAPGGATDTLARPWADKLTQALGQDTLSDLASQFGLNTGDTAGALSNILPGLIDKLTPQGSAPAGGLGNAADLMGMLGGLLRKS